jgi:pimeloyl-ACP methyl ester carboxylesterase
MTSTDSNRSLLPVLVLGAAIAAPPAHAATKAVAAGPWGGKTGGTGAIADVNGIKLYYESLGRGPGRPLVLLHGGLGAIEMFGPNLAALANGRRVIAVDLQGHGRTADIDRPFSLEAMSDDVAALLQHLAIERADLMGYSLGGGVAVMMAIRHPEKVGKLVAVSTVLKRSGFYPEILAMQGQITPAMAEAMKQTPMYQLYASLAPRPEDWPRLLGKIGDFMKKDFDYSKQVAGIKAPTLVVAGDADIFPAARAVEFFALLGGGKRDGGWDGAGRPTSRLAILPGLTHYTIGNAPALAATVVPFLDE